ncbi:hypothetical protein SAMN04515661_10364 [Candidatus Frackibacter sp. WG11]|nr:hypothetical protein [Candidatus Frackibacter sp. WG11]SDC16663.1 hypothetical protein SAMN04515661_10364 [Candidatus Frackibacter sp. WG11]
MGNKKKNSWLTGLIIALIIISLPPAFMYIKSLSDGTDVGKVRRKIKEHLYKEYGKEFVVDRIGIRSSRGQEFYQARIYPKSIIGTNKERDEYYYSTASVSKKSFDRLGGVGDGYSIVQMNIGSEEYLLPKTKEIFGKRVLLKTDVKYKKRESEDFFGWRLESNFEKMLNKTKNNPKDNRIELNLQVYIFNRIDDKKEKEKRRQQIFDFVQYLKDEGLFEYLELGVIFIDERVLAPSYDKFRSKIYRSDEVVVEVEGEEIYMPPMKLRREMSKVLQEELDKMSEKELLVSMRKINK